MPCFLLKGNISKKWLTIECSLGIDVVALYFWTFLELGAAATTMRCEATHAARSCVKVEKSMTL